MSSASPTRTYVIDTSVLLSDPQALRRFAEHDVVLPVVVITELEAKRHHSELGYFARTALRHPRRAAHRARPAGRAGPGQRPGRHRPRRAEPHRSGDPAGRVPAGRQRLADPGRGAELRRRGPRRDPGVEGPADAGQGVRRRAERGGVPRRAGRGERVDRDGRARGRAGRPGPAVRGGHAGPGPGPRPALPHRRGAAQRQVLRAGPGDPGQGAQAGQGGPGRVRHPRPLGRAAGRAGPAARPVDRHRLARRAGGHRQVGARPVRRAGGGAGAAAARQGGGLPAAVRRGRAGARLPARAPRGRRWRPGRRRSSTPSGR